MANGQSGVKFFIITTTVVLGFLISSGSTTQNEEEGSLFDIAQAILKESVGQQNSGPGLNVIGGLIQGFMQTEGGKQLGDVLTKNGAGTIDIISNLASIWQTSQINVNVNSNDGRGKSELNIDPSILGSMVGLLNTLNTANSDAGNNNVDENNNDKQEMAGQHGHNDEESPINWDAVLTFAGNMISSMSKGNQQKQENGGLESFLSVIPVLLNSFSGHHNSHYTQSIPHHIHSPFLPPFLENLHEYWDHFSKTEFGKSLWDNSGLSELVLFFKNSNGELDVEKVFESLGNNTIRRKWINTVSSFVAMWVKHFTNTQVQKSYLETIQVISNGFLRSNGFPKQTYLDLNKPSESISALINTILKSKFNIDVHSESYVTPIVTYVQELFKKGQTKGLKGVENLSVEEIKMRLAETMDSDIIDPLLRVYRAYTFSRKMPPCTKYLMCTINQSQGKTKSGLKPTVTKLFSLGASWFFSDDGKNSLWDIYNAVGDNQCSKYDKGCSEFHTEDIKATTEYYHNEL